MSDTNAVPMNAALTTQIIPRKYALNVHLENTVKAFLSGFLSKVKEPSKEYHLIHMQSVNPLDQVLIGSYNLLHREISIRSDVRSACALQGVKAQDIVDVLLKMRFIDDLTGKSYAAVTVDYKVRGVISPAVTSLDAVYTACRYVLKAKVLRQYKELQQATKSKTVTKKKGN